MKKKKIILGLSIIFYVLIIFVSFVYYVIPGINKIIRANDIKELSLEEKNVLINDINTKYSSLDADINEKYTSLVDDLGLKYDSLIDEKNKEYDLLEDNIKKDYADREKEINSKKSSISAKQQNEFFAHGFSSLYYSLQDELKELNNEANELFIDKNKDINSNNDKRNSDIFILKNKKGEEIRALDVNKKNELDGLMLQKENELDDVNNRMEQRKSVRLSGIKSILIGLVIILIPIIYVVVVYNKLMRLSNDLKEKWSQVDVYLKQRSDLIPNIVETVKGYASYEENTLVNVIKARENFINASCKEDEIKANCEFENNVKFLFALGESYPELKANENFMGLQKDLRRIEDCIANSRSEYNNSVLKYKNKLGFFPSNIVGYMFNFKDEVFFEFDDDIFSVKF